MHGPHACQIGTHRGQGLAGSTTVSPAPLTARFSTATIRAVLRPALTPPAIALKESPVVNHPRPNESPGMTRLFYVDESRDHGHHYHVGMLVRGSTVAAAVEASLETIGENAYDSGTALSGSELHAVDIFHGTRQWANGSSQERATVLEEALGTIPQDGVEVIARGVDLRRFSKRYPGTDPYRWEFSNLLERLNERLQELEDFGLVIADQNHHYRELLQRDVADGKLYGTGGYRNQRLLRILDTAHFVESGLSRMIQLADLAAFVLRRRATIPTERDSRLEALMSRLHVMVAHGFPLPAGQYHTIRY
jgi:Protein of unknown function (DUF3800)